MITFHHNDDADVQRMLQFQNGDESAFQQIVDEYHSVVFRSFLKQFRDWHRAEDLTQEVFLRVHRARDRYRPRAKFRTWLFCISRNVAINSHRTQTRHPEFGLGEVINMGDTPAEQAPCRAEQRERTQLVHQAINRLPDRQRDAIRLQFEVNSHQEIGTRMDMTPMAVKSLLSRARVNLRTQLQGKTS